MEVSSQLLQADRFINPLAADFISNPYPIYARLRAEQPVYWHETMQTWFIARHGDCVRVLRDPSVFTSDYRRAGEAVDPAILSVQTTDPPEQTLIRRLLADALRSVDVRSVERSAAADAQDLLARAAGIGTTNFVTQIAAPYSLSAAMHILGIKLRLQDYVQDAKRITDSSMPALLPEFTGPGIESRKRLSVLLQRGLAEDDGSGVIGYLNSRPEIADLPEDVLVNSLRVTLLAITSSTGRFFTLGLKTLLEAPGGIQDFATAPSRDAAIHELVRFDGPFQAQEKICLSSTRLYDKDICAGDKVVVLFGSANRDEQIFDDPDRLDFTRRSVRHLGFGRGNHACLGTHLGLVLSRAILGHIANDYRKIRLSCPPEMDINPTIRGVKTMNVEFG